MKLKDSATVATLMYNFSLPEDEVNKIIESLEVINKLYSVFGMAKAQDSSWIHRKQKTMNSVDLQRVICVSNTFNETIKTLCHYVSAHGEGSWVKLLKWKFASFFSSHNGQDIPKPPFEKSYVDNLEGGGRFFLPHVLIPGVFDKYFKSLSPEKRINFIDSVLLLKKGMPSVPSSMLAKAKEDTKLKLTTEPILSDKERNIVYNDFCRQREMYYQVSEDEIKRQLRRTTTELFEKSELKLTDILDMFFPSIKSNYVNTGLNGGTLSVFLNRYGSPDRTMNGQAPKHFDENGLPMYSYPQTVKTCTGMARVPGPEMFDDHFLSEGDDLIDYGSRSAKLFDIRPSYYGSRGAAEKIKNEQLTQLGYEQFEEGEVVCVDLRSLQDKWKEFYFGIFEEAINEEPLVECVALAEPLKVRVISKGPPLTYAALKPIQKWLWANVQKHQVFTLIGTPVTDTLINKVLGVLTRNEEVVSGDYAAATDNLKSWVSETILDQLMIEIGENIKCLSQLPDNFLTDLKGLMLKALTRHKFVLGDRVIDSKGREKYVNLTVQDQKTGQLMGSIISFPFLCIANAALCRYSMELANHKTYRLTNDKYNGSGRIAPLLINGDDCVFKGYVGAIRPIWEEMTAMAGLESSVGKTYFSSTFCTINSTIYEFDDEQGLWRQRKAINMGLLLGRGKDGTIINSAHLLGAKCMDLKRTCPDNMWPDLKRSFIRQHFVALRDSGLSWWLPAWLGGLGLPIDREDEISDEDRRKASVIRANMGTNTDLKPSSMKDPQEWLMHQKVLRTKLRPNGLDKGSTHYKALLSNDKIVDFEENYRRVYKAATVELLFTHGFYDLWTNADKALEIAIKKNQRVMAEATRHLTRKTLCPLTGESVDFYQPMPIDELLYEPRPEYPACYVQSFEEPFGDLYGVTDESW